MNTHYAILGGGRLARHMAHYFSLLDQPWSAWARNPESPLNSSNIPNNEARLRRIIAPASHVLLLVSDDAIATLVRQYPFLHSKTLVHCAGAISQPGIAGAHPLMTFGPELYTLEQYEAMPFVVEEGYDFGALFPALQNPHHTISVEQKALYHAFCVMAGNFPQILWQELTNRLADQFDLPASVLTPYLTQVVKNFCTDPLSALTGPLARGDNQTIARNQQALSGDQLQGLYRAFCDFHQKPASLGNSREVAL